MVLDLCGLESGAVVVMKRGHGRIEFGSAVDGGEEKKMVVTGMRCCWPCAAKVWVRACAQRWVIWNWQRRQGLGGDELIWVFEIAGDGRGTGILIVSCKSRVLGVIDVMVFCR
ncbi:hypothetical protein M0R45_022301 [Rubus argutus]|uniref:Uncharacterized protein n=1 Tax=Rubus argutus TaxID=59490 RepID=A0AAW1XGD7_RUBAR